MCLEILEVFKENLYKSVCFPHTFFIFFFLLPFAAKTQSSRRISILLKKKRNNNGIFLVTMHGVATRKVYLGCEILFFFFFDWRLWLTICPLILDPGTFLLYIYLPTQRGGSCLSQQVLAQGPAHFCLKFSSKTSSCCQSSSSYLNSVIQHCLLTAAHPTEQVTPQVRHQSHQWLSWWRSPTLQQCLDS